VNQTKQLFFILLSLTLPRIEYHFILACSFFVSLKNCKKVLQIQDMENTG